MTRSVAAKPKKRTAGRKKFFHQLFTTALEGGIGYWSEAHEYRWSKLENYSQMIDGMPTHGSHDVEDLDNFYARITNNEDDRATEAAYQPGTSPMLVHPAFPAISQMRQLYGNNHPLCINIDVMERGWNLLVDKVIEATKSEDTNAPFSNTYLRQAIIQWLTDGEEGDSDAYVADLVVQLGLFGEVVYS